MNILLAGEKLEKAQGEQQGGIPHPGQAEQPEL